MLICCLEQSLITLGRWKVSNSVPHKDNGECCGRAVLEWNNAAYEEKEKFYYFTHPARDTTSSHLPLQPKEKNGELRKNGVAHWK